MTIVSGHQQQIQEARSPWAGIRVLDITDCVAGSYCTLLMTGFGAEVITIDSPVPNGDISCTETDDLSAVSSAGLFSVLKRGKKSITLDLTKPRGKELFLQLIEKADVLVNNHSHNQAAGLGLTFAEAKHENHSLVLTSITNFGQSGPYVDFTAEELVINALGGFVYGVGEPKCEPLGGQGVRSQILAGACAYFGSLVALMARELTGQGQLVDISSQEVVATCLEGALTLAKYNGWTWRRSGGRRDVGYHPISNYPCRDGHINITILEDYEWCSFCELIGRPEFGRDPRFETPQGRMEHADEVDAIITEWLKTKSCNEVYHSAQAKKLVFSPVNTIAQVLTAPQLLSRGSFGEVQVADDSVTVTRRPFLMDRTPWDVRGKPPRLGEHNSEVFTRLLGLGPHILAELEVGGII